jgi:o-succinylbenzoate synthase
MSKAKLRIFSYPLSFKKPARTSRNVFENRTVYFLVFEENQSIHIGEAAPLEKLSIDAVPGFANELKVRAREWFENRSALEMDLAEWPSIRFALESIEMSLKSSWETQRPIQINGLVWMNSIPEMYEEAMAKIQAGFRCMKFKVGALDFDEECRLIQRIRKSADAFKLEIRLDANGAFEVDDALEKLNELSRFDIHSLEQPIAPKQWGAMEEVCSKSSIPIALDEELIYASRERLHRQCIQQIKPQYIILKPTLIGGFSSANLWIQEAKKIGVPWWATSALESNVGLTAITHWVGETNNPLPQGLGTGSLYTNNIRSPFKIEGEQVHLNSELGFDMDAIISNGACIFELE